MFAVRGVLIAAVLAGCGGGGGFPDAPPIDSPPAPGTFTLAWAVDNASNAAIQCAQVGAQAVTVLTHNRAFGGGSTEVFTCQTLMGMSQGLVAGVWDMSFELDSAGEVLATAPDQKGIVIGAGENVTLAPLTFTVDATGSLKLHLNTNTVGGNCAPIAMTGAAISGMTLTLSHMDTGVCEPLTLTVGAGANKPGFQYVVNCASPTVAPCIDADQELSATSVPSGPYQIHVRGKQIAPTDCWTNDDTFPVPPLGHELNRTLNLGFTTTAPSC